MEITRKINNGEKETTIVHLWELPSAEARVYIGGRGEGGNNACHFTLEIIGGQVYFKEELNGGSVKMFGEWERECLIELLKQVVIELEAIKQ